MNTKAEIVVLGEAGHHNQKFDASAHRVLQGASWKRQRIVVLIPAGRMMPSKVALAHWNIVFPPNNGVARLLCQGMEVGDAYSQALEYVLANEELRDWEYVLTIESDNIPPADGVLALVQAMEEHPEYSCIGGLYWTKGEGGVPQIWGDPNDPLINFRPQVPIAGTVQRCNGTGMGFNLWRLSMFKDERLRRPWFKTVANASGAGTQDLYFWSDAIKHGFRCAVDNRVLVGHYDFERDIVW